MSLLLLFNPLIIRGYNKNDVIVDITITPDTSELILNLEEPNIFGNLIKPEVFELVLDLKVPDITYSRLPISSNIKELRYDDIALTQFIKDKMKDFNIFNVDVIDGYPVNEAIKMPCIIVEHSLSFDRELEIRDYYKRSNRYFNIFVFAPTKGQRDDLINFVQNLVGFSFYTADGRHKEISEIEHLNFVISQLNTADLKTKYNYIHYDGNTSYSTIEYSEEMGSNIFVLDMDLDVLTQNESGNRYCYIFNSYREIDDDNNLLKNGFKLYLDKYTGYLYSVIGLTTVDYTTSMNFSSYLNNRVHLTYAITFSSTKIKIQAYINGSLVLNTSAFWFFGIPRISSKITIGANLIYDGFENFSNFCKMNFYSLRISDDISSVYTKTGEFLTRNELNDYIYMKCNEGDGEYVYNELSSLIGENSIDKMTLFGDYYWYNYLEELFNGYAYRSGTLKLTLIGNSIKRR